MTSVPPMTSVQNVLCLDVFDEQMDVRERDAHAIEGSEVPLAPQPE